MTKRYLAVALVMFFGNANANTVLIQGANPTVQAGQVATVFQGAYHTRSAQVFTIGYTPSFYTPTILVQDGFQSHTYRNAVQPSSYVGGAGWALYGFQTNAAGLNGGASRNLDGAVSAPISSGSNTPVTADNILALGGSQCVSSSDCYVTTDPTSSYGASSLDGWVVFPAGHNYAYYLSGTPSTALVRAWGAGANGTNTASFLDPWGVRHALTGSGGTYEETTITTHGWQITVEASHFATHAGMRLHPGTFHEFCGKSTPGYNDLSGCASVEAESPFNLLVGYNDTNSDVELKVLATGSVSADEWPNDVIVEETLQIEGATLEGSYRIQGKPSVRTSTCSVRADPEVSYTTSFLPDDGLSYAHVPLHVETQCDTTPGVDEHKGQAVSVGTEGLNRVYIEPAGEDKDDGRDGYYIADGISVNFLDPITGAEIGYSQGYIPAGLQPVDGANSMTDSIDSVFAWDNTIKPGTYVSQFIVVYDYY